MYNIYFNPEDGLYYSDHPDYQGVGFLTEEELKDCIEEMK